MNCSSLFCPRKQILATRVIARRVFFPTKQSPSPAGSIRSAEINKKLHEFGGLTSVLCCPWPRSGRNAEALAFCFLPPAFRLPSPVLRLLHRPGLLPANGPDQRPRPTAPTNGPDALSGCSFGAERPGHRSRPTAPMLFRGALSGCPFVRERGLICFARFTQKDT